MRVPTLAILVGLMAAPAVAQPIDFPMVPFAGPMMTFCLPMMPNCGPMGAGPGSGNSGAATQAPTVIAVVPNVGPPAGGTAVIISGTQFIGLSGAGAVVFGANNATSYTVISPTAISAVSPAGLAGTVDVRVTNPIGQSAIVVADQFTYSVGCGPGSADFTIVCNDQYFIATQ